MSRSLTEAAVPFGEAAASVGRWTVGVIAWSFQYCFALPMYAIWRFFARFGWALLAVCTLGISALVRHIIHKGDRRHSELLGRSAERYNWSLVLRPWFKDWVLA